jgi:hypothetical protein
MVPRQSWDTRKPVLPNLVYFIPRSNAGVAHSRAHDSSATGGVARQGHALAGSAAPASMGICPSFAATDAGRRMVRR